jgi:hypothetical protein
MRRARRNSITFSPARISSSRSTVARWLSLDTAAMRGELAEQVEHARGEQFAVLHAMPGGGIGDHRPGLAHQPARELGADRAEQAGHHDGETDASTTDTQEFRSPARRRSRCCAG